MKKNFFLLTWVLALSGVIFSQSTVYVNVSADGTNDGSSWTNAFTSVQAGIDAANDMTPKGEVWVAEGTYFPTAYLSDPLASPQTDTVYLSFLMYSGVNVYGGFEGTETTKEIGVSGGRQLISDGMAWEFAHPSILNGTGSYHVVWFATNGFESFTYAGISGLYQPVSLPELTILEGFTITGGNACINSRLENETNSKKKFNHLVAGGVGMNGNSKLNRCIIENNKAKFGGGGIAAFGKSTVENCMIRNNEATGANIYASFIIPIKDFWKACGGGMILFGGTETINKAIVRDSYIENNLAKAMNGLVNENTNEGGGIHIYNGTVKNCIIQGNNIEKKVNEDVGSTSSCGGGVFIYGKGILDSCTITDNGYINDLGNNAAGVWADCEYSTTGPINNSEIIISNCYIHSNRKGHAIILNARPAIVYNCRIVNNVGYGLAHFGNAKDCQTTNCIIANNSNGFYVSANAADNHLISTTVVNNGASGGISANSNCTIDNCIVWGNAGTPIFTAATISHSAFNFSPLPTGTSNIELDADNNLGPKFTSPSSEIGLNGDDWSDADWSLQGGSPCINSGNSSLLPTNILTDIMGANRVQSCAVDMGAYESPYSAFVEVNDTAICNTGDVSLIAQTSYGTLSWFESDGTTEILDSIVSNVSSNTFYVVTASDGICPSYSDTLWVVVDAPLTLNIMSDTTVCHGSTIEIAANSNGQIQWFDIDMNLYESDTILILNDTKLIVHASNSCDLQADTVQIYAHINETPSFNYSESTVNGSQTEVIFTNTTQNLGDYDFVWDFGDESTEANNNVTVVHAFTNGNSYDVVLTATDQTYGCMSFETTTVFIQNTSIQEDLSNSVIFYPVPTNTSLKIEAPFIIERLQIYDALGRLITDKKVNAQDVILDVSGFLSGTYNVNILTEKGFIHKTFIKL